MNLESSLRRTFFRKLISSRAGRAHVLNLMMHAEEGDEAGVFDQLQRVVEGPRLQKVIARHQADERKHANMYRACLARTGAPPGPLPSGLMIIRRVAFAAGGAFAAGARTKSADGISTREDVMNTYALLLAIEERGVQQFPLIGAEFRRIGDHETADTFDRVTKDEIRHTKYCRAIGRRYASDDLEWQRAIAKYRMIENRAFLQAGLAGIAYAIDKGLAWNGPLARVVAAVLRLLDPMKEDDGGAFFAGANFSRRQ